MYLVKIYDGPEDTKGLVIHSPYVSDVKLNNPTVKIELSGISSMQFGINLNNPAWNKIKPMKTLVEVVRTYDGKKVFYGRVLSPSQNMKQSGSFSVDYVCEGRKAYLHDSAQRHAEFHDVTVKYFLGVLLSNHNNQVEPHKQFKLGRVTVDSSSGTLYRYLGYESTYDTIKDKLIDRLGGHIVIRDEEDGMYLDYLAEVGEVKTTPIQLAYNMQDLKRDVDPTNVITRLVPLGAKIKSEDETATDASEARLTIESVNNGVDYLDDTLMIDEFGVIERSIVYDDINDAGILKTRGQQFLSAQKASSVNIDTTAVNVDLLETHLDKFEVGNYHPVDNEVLAINEPVQIIGMTIDLEQPQVFKLDIGDKQQTLSQYQADANKQMRTVRELENRVNSLGTTNMQLSSSLKDAQLELSNLQDRLNNIDVENLPEELQTISQQIVAVQTAISDIEDAIGEIPMYTEATEIQSGLMSNLDKGKLNKIAITESVNLDKLNKITVTDPIDLDDLIDRIIALENMQGAGN